VDILARKLEYPRFKIQFAKHMKLGKNDEGVDTLPLLGIGSKAPMEGATELQRHILELRRKDGPSRGCHTQRSIP
jgi:hypothetical protein